MLFQLISLRSTIRDTVLSYRVLPCEILRVPVKITVHVLAATSYPTVNSTYFIV